MINRLIVRLAIACGLLCLLSIMLIGSVPAQAQRSATAIPTNTRRPTVAPIPPSGTPAPTATAVSTFIATVPPGFLGGDPITWTPPPSGVKFPDHFVFARPIGADGVNYPARNYAYGATDGGGRPPHHGDDFQNPSGTPVLAAADGVVEYAGDDVRQLFGPQPNFYGNVIVLHHRLTDYGGQPVFTLYGHLSRIGVSAGQAVKQSDVIGAVGSAGVAVGAHLHFEVRVGDPTDYNAVRNPELWIAPFSSYGALAGRVMDVHGRVLPGMHVELQAAIYREATTYADAGTPGDTLAHENFAVSDLPGGYYLVYVKADSGALRYRNTVLIRANQVSWLDIYISGGDVP